jgi:hypothetical protein
VAKAGRFVAALLPALFNLGLFYFSRKQFNEASASRAGGRGLAGGLQYALRARRMLPSPRAARGRVVPGGPR